MFEYDIGGNIINPDTSEAFAQISPNKTLFIQKLTSSDPVKPEIVEDLKTVDDVFNHFKPSCKIEFSKIDGSMVNENLSFTNLGDFGVKNIINQSPYLSEVNLEHDSYLKILKQLKSNKALKTVIDNPETKTAFINALKSLALELEENQS